MKHSHLIAATAVYLTVGACSNSDDGISIRGELNAPTPSGSLPAAILPSACLPAGSLPAGSLPTIEVDETVSSVPLRSLEVVLESDQVTQLESESGVVATAVFSVDEGTGDIEGTLTAAPAAGVTIDDVELRFGFAGEEGALLATFLPSASDPFVFELSTNIAALPMGAAGNDLQTFSAGGWHLALTSTAAAGASLESLRGQLFTDDVDVVRTELQGAQENPPVQNAPGISGVGYATFDLAAETAVLNVSVEGFTPFLDAPVGPVHMHAGPAGVNGPIVVPLRPVGGSDVIFSGTIGLPGSETPIQAPNFAGLAQGHYYFNAHSEANPSGEVRGQIVPEGIDVTRTELQGAQENPPVPNAPGVSGVGYATIDLAAETAVLNVSIEGFAPFLDAPVGPVHLHAGSAGVNGPVVVPLRPVDGSDVMFSGSIGLADSEAPLQDPDFAGLAMGSYYFNVHSELNPSGEVRGQVVPDGVQVVRTELQGAQQNPPAANAPGVSGVGYATFNLAAETAVLNVSIEGFTPFLDSAAGPVHLHVGPAGIGGPVIVPLRPVDGSDGMFSGSIGLADSETPLQEPDFAALAVGHYYFNVHSELNLAGEVRGQIVPDGVQVARTELQGAQENPPLTNAPGIFGVGYATINLAAETAVLNVLVEGFTPFLDAPIGPVHVHAGPAGVNGPIVVPLRPMVDSEVRFSGSIGLPDSETPLQDPNFAGLAAGNYYFNVHSELHPSGEVRGQIVPSGIGVVRTELQGAQENPPVVNAPGVSGVGYATIDLASEVVVMNVAVEGFVPFLDAPVGPVHLHAGPAGNNGPIIVPLRPVNGSDVMFSGSIGLPDSEEPLQGPNFAGLAKGDYYFNVHSEANPGGAVRGQVSPQNTASRRAELGTPGTANFGVGYLNFTNLQTGAFNTNVRLNGSTASRVSLNQVNGGDDEIIDLTESEDDPSFFSAASQLLGSGIVLDETVFSHTASGLESLSAAP